MFTGTRADVDPDRPAAGLEPAGTPAAATPVTTRRGMFGSPLGPGDTSGYAGLVTTSTVSVPTPRPYGGWFDDVVDARAEKRAAAARGEEFQQ